MDPTTQTFIEKLKSITLSAGERANLRTRLIAKMRDTAVTLPEPSPWSWVLYMRRLEVALLVLVIFGSYGGAVSFAAQNTLPGDVLYPIKTDVTEPFARLTTISPVAQATLETNILETRLQEAEALDTANKLTAPLKQEIQAAVREQSMKAEAKATTAANVPAVATYRAAAPMRDEAATSTPKASPTMLVRESATSSEGQKGDTEQAALQKVLKRHARILQKLDLTGGGGD